MVLIDGGVVIPDLIILGPGLVSEKETEKSRKRMGKGDETIHIVDEVIQGAVLMTEIAPMIVDTALAQEPLLAAVGDIAELDHLTAVGLVALNILLVLTLILRSLFGRWPLK